MASSDMLRLFSIFSIFLVNTHSLGFLNNSLECLCESKQCLFEAPRVARPSNFSLLHQCLVHNGLQPPLSALNNPQDQEEPLVIKIGILVEMRFPLTLGAASLAIEAINNDSSILPNFRLEFVFERIHKRILKVESDAITRMTEMRDQGVMAFIGSSHSCKNEALVAAAWNMPMVSFKLSDKRTYPTFVRTLPPSEKMAKSIIAVLEHFKWNRVVLVASTSDVYTPIKNAFQNLAKLKNITIKATKNIGSNYLFMEEGMLEQIIRETKSETRIYVFIGDKGALFDFVNFMYFMQSKTDPYEILAIDITVDLNEKDICEKYLKSLIPAWSLGDINWSAFRSVLMILPAHKDARSDPKYKDFMSEIIRRSTMDPFCEPYHQLMKQAEIPIEAAFLYDAVKIYALGADRVFKAGGDIRNGTEIVRNIIQAKTYHSDVQGIDVQIDEHGDSEGNYVLLATVAEENYCSQTDSVAFVPVGTFNYDSKHIPIFLPNDKSHLILWPGGQGDEFIPKTEPQCGFQNEHCQLIKNPAAFGVGTFFLCLVLIFCFGFCYRQYKYEQTLARLLWKIDLKEIRDVEPLDLKRSGSCRSASHQRLNRLRSDNSLSSSISSRSSDPERGVLETDLSHVPRIQIGNYKGNVVAIKRVFKKSVDLKRSILKELNCMRDIRHDNLVPFLGACIDNVNCQVLIVTPYCSRGSLVDVLDNEDYRLDNMFVASLVADLVKGMIYLHDSQISFHGNLKSSNCLVDTRWVLQISDFGLREFKSGELIDRESLHYHESLLWMAPEFLHLQRSLWATASNPATSAKDLLKPGSDAFQKADVYSFALVLYDIMGRKGPWGKRDLNKREIKGILDKLLYPHVLRHLRPNLDVLDCEDYVKKCIRECWQEEPSERPDFRTIKQLLGPMQTGLKANIFDNMMAIMEKYATTLESQVAERTHLLMEEKKKTDALLYNMLPRTVAESLKQGIPVEAESFDCVTIYFSDVVGFTEISAASTPMEVVMLLNDLYTCFDSIIEGYDVYKVETIGDAYMVVSGLPVKNGLNHANQIASLALDLLNNIQSFEIRHKPGRKIRLRIGVHSGPCVAGVVGHKMPRYCLFGDTVNTASRMESTGEPNKVHVSNSTREILLQRGGYEFQERGPVWVKGKGEMVTYWLVGRNESEFEAVKQPRGVGFRRHGTRRRATEPSRDVFDLIQDIRTPANTPK